MIGKFEILMAYKEKQLQDISKQFQIYGEILHAETFKIGHINETYSATYDQGGMRVRYIHQKINKNVFKNPPAVMKNVMRVTTHIRRRLEAQNARDITRRSLVVIPTRDGQSHYRSRDGEYWRTFVFIEGVQTFEAVQSPDQALQAGRAFGEFQSLLVDLPDGRLNETILGFHNTRKRFAALQQAIQNDHVNRAQAAKPEIAVRAEARADGGCHPRCHGEEEDPRAHHPQRHEVQQRHARHGHRRRQVRGGPRHGHAGLRAL